MINAAAAIAPTVPGQTGKGAAPVGGELFALSMLSAGADAVTTDPAAIAEAPRQRLAAPGTPLPSSDAAAVDPALTWLPAVNIAVPTPLDIPDALAALPAAPMPATSLPGGSTMPSLLRGSVPINPALTQDMILPPVRATVVAMPQEGARTTDAPAPNAPDRAVATPAASGRDGDAPVPGGVGDAPVRPQPRPAAVAVDTRRPPEPIATDIATPPLPAPAPLTPTAPLPDDGMPARVAVADESMPASSSPKPARARDATMRGTRHAPAPADSPPQSPRPEAGSDDAASDTLSDREATPPTPSVATPPVASAPVTPAPADLPAPATAAAEPAAAPARRTPHVAASTTIAVASTASHTVPAYEPLLPGHHATAPASAPAEDRPRTAATPSDPTVVPPADGPSQAPSRTVVADAVVPAADPAERVLTDTPAPDAAALPPTRPQAAPSQPAAVDTRMPVTTDAAMTTTTARERRLPPGDPDTDDAPVQTAAMPHPERQPAPIDTPARIADRPAPTVAAASATAKTRPVSADIARPTPTDRHAGTIAPIPAGDTSRGAEPLAPNADAERTPARVTAPGTTQDAPTTRSGEPPVARVLPFIAKAPVPTAIPAATTLGRATAAPVTATPISDPAPPATDGMPARSTTPAPTMASVVPSAPDSMPATPVAATGAMPPVAPDVPRVTAPAASSAIAPPDSRSATVRDATPTAPAAASQAAPQAAPPVDAAVARPVIAVTAPVAVAGAAVVDIPPSVATPAPQRQTFIREVGGAARQTVALRPQAAPARQPAAGTTAPAAEVFGAAMHAATADDRDRGESLAPIAAAPTAAVDIRPIATVADTASPTLDMRQGQWPNAMIDHIERLRDAADAQDTRIRLVPDALGTIDVSVKNVGDAIHVRFAAADATTRALIEDASPRLAQIAEERGVRIGQTVVEAASSAATQQQAGGQSSSGQSFGGQSAGGQPQTAAQAQTGQQQPRQQQPSAARQPDRPARAPSRDTDAADDGRVA